MNNILVLRQGIDVADNSLIRSAHLVIVIKPDGNIELLKNRHGSNGLIGKCGELLDISNYAETISKISEKDDVGV